MMRRSRPSSALTALGCSQPCTAAALARLPRPCSHEFGMWRVVMARVLRLRIARHQGCIQLGLMIVIVRQRSVDLGRCQVRILLDDLGCTIAMGYVIRDNVNYPVASPVNARDSVGIKGDVWVGHGLTH